MKKEVPVEKTEQYKEGYVAFERGEDKTTCPYLKSSSSYDKWMRGWEDARGEEEDNES